MCVIQRVAGVECGMEPVSELKLESQNFKTIRGLQDGPVETSGCVEEKSPCRIKRFMSENSVSWDRKRTGGIF